MKFAHSLLVCAALTGCAPIQHRSEPEQAMGQPLMAGVGDVVFKLNKERSLENVLGNADIFGRKTNEGFVEVRFLGTEPGGVMVFSRRDVSIATNETTMSRTPLAVTSARSQTTAAGAAYPTGNGANFSGSAISTYQSSTIAPIGDYHIAIPSDAFPIRVSPAEPVFIVDGYSVQIEAASQNAIRFRIRHN